MQQVWQALWKLRVPNKIKNFGWRVFHGILPTWVNLAKKKIFRERFYPICTRLPETEIHVLWECPTAKDVWAGSRIKLQKCNLEQHDMVQLFQYLIDKLDIEEVELFLVQAWVIWNQRKSVLHGGKLKEPSWLNKRAAKFLEEFKQVQQHLATPTRQPNGSIWRPSDQSWFKLNFDVAIFQEHNNSGFGAMIRNNQGKVMAAMATKGPQVSCSEEVETLAFRKALEFAVDAGFLELIVEGDNVNVMRAVSSSTLNFSMLGNVIADIHCILCGLGRVSISCIKREGNRVAHVLAKYVRVLDEDMFWMEEVPQVAVETMCQDSLLMNT